ncbi:MAG: outer membrane beta-barrel protein [Bacteroidaceae bacterium]|nr:outer membrane beta-barrel protein [Bacteroidaceae bacterium]
MVKRNVLVVALLLTVSSILAQSEYSVYLGGSYPLGDYGRFSTNNEEIAWYDKTSNAGAGVGFDIGIKMKSDIKSIEGLGFIITADLFYNGHNNDLKDLKKDYEEELEDFSSDFKFRMPKYINIPVMLGLNFETQLKSDIDLWTELAVGANLGKTTKYLREYGYDDYDDYYDYHLCYSMTYNTTLSLAYQFGIGVKLSDKISLGIHYYSLGSRRLEGEEYYEEHYSGNDDDYDEDFKLGRINPNMLNFRIGYCF